MATWASAFGATGGFNPTQFASSDQAAKLAAMFKGSAYGDSPAGPIHYSQPMQMVKIPGAAGASNAGLLNDWMTKNPTWQQSPFLTQQLMMMTGAPASSMPNAPPVNTTGGVLPPAQSTPGLGMTRPGTAAGDPRGVPQVSSIGGSILPQNMNQPQAQPTAQGGGAGMDPSTLQALYAALTQGGPNFTPTGGPALGPNSTFFQGATPGQPPPNGSSAGGGANSIDSWLANYVSHGGNPTSTTAAWQTAVDAMKRNQGENFNNLNEAFGASGNRFSTGYGTAATDYWTQASKDQSALLANMTMQAQEAAAGRQLTAGQQLSGQAFSSDQLSQQLALQAALSLGNQSSSAASQLAQLSALGAQGLYGGENSAANSMYGSTMSAFPQQIQAYLQNLGLGSQLGGQQNQTLTDQINRLYQQFQTTLPQYNPMLPYLSQAGTSYPPQAYPSFPPSMLSAILGAVGGIGGALPGIINAIGGLINPP